MFKETILEINHELEWISYELGRQSTSKTQENNLKDRRDHLRAILALCKAYNDCNFLGTGTDIINKIQGK